MAEDRPLGMDVGTLLAAPAGELNPVQVAGLQARLRLALRQHGDVVYERDLARLELANLEAWILEAKEHTAPAIAKAIEERLGRAAAAYDRRPIKPGAERGGFPGIDPLDENAHLRSTEAGS